MKGRSLPWILGLGGLFLLLLGVGLALLLARPAADTARVYSDGELIAVLDLSRDQTITVPYGEGQNVITVREGKVAVTDASCPDQICMGRGWCDGGLPIVCLPNRLVIRFSNQGDVDAVLH